MISLFHPCCVITPENSNILPVSHLPWGEAGEPKKTQQNATIVARKKDS
jgi:hypothetical protein